MNLREEAEEIVRNGRCGACSAVGCHDEDICDGFQDEVESTLKEWAEEDAARELEEIE